MHPECTNDLFRANQGLRLFYYQVHASIYGTSWITCIPAEYSMRRCVSLDIPTVNGGLLQEWACQTISMTFPVCDRHPVAWAKAHLDNGKICIAFNSFLQQAMNECFHMLNLYPDGRIPLGSQEAQCLRINSVCTYTPKRCRCPWIWGYLSMSGECRYLLICCLRVT